MSGGGQTRNRYRRLLRTSLSWSISTEARGRHCSLDPLLVYSLRQYLLCFFFIKTILLFPDKQMCNKVLCNFMISVFVYPHLNVVYTQCLNALVGVINQIQPTLHLTDRHCWKLNKPGYIMLCIYLAVNGNYYFQFLQTLFALISEDIVFIYREPSRTVETLSSQRRNNTTSWKVTTGWLTAMM